GAGGDEDDIAVGPHRAADVEGYRVLELELARAQRYRAQVVDEVAGEEFRVRAVGGDLQRTGRQPPAVLQDQAGGRFLRGERGRGDTRVDDGVDRNAAGLGGDRQAAQRGDLAAQPEAFAVAQNEPSRAEVAGAQGCNRVGRGIQNRVGALGIQLQHGGGDDTA